MIVDGSKIAENLYQEIAEQISVLKKAPILTVFTCAPNFETQKYLNLKKKKADAVGIDINVIEVGEEITTEGMVAMIQKSISTTDGIIVQLPLPRHINTDEILRSIPPTNDVDALNPETKKFLSPVIGAIKEILSEHSVDARDKNVTIIGKGKLVGIPAFKWFTEQDAHTQAVALGIPDISTYTKKADIIVSGAGSPNLIKPEMIKDNVIILDAGTSEDGGELRGDMDPLCTPKCSLFTPVPGGIGPITIAVLLQNVVKSAQTINS